MKTKAFYFFFFLFPLFFSEWSFGLEDCFNYECVRQDMKEYEFGWEKLKAFESNKDNFILDKRWPTVDLNLTPAEERARFGTTGLEMAQKAYLAQRWDGEQLRMIVFVKVVREKGVRKILGWRTEKNPPMPEEYLDPAYPDKDKKGVDWKLLTIWVYPPDVRGTGFVCHSYNDKAKDNDMWLWFPSLRKVRRLTPANGGDFAAGTYKTFGEAFLRRVTDEVHQIIGETTVYGFYPIDYLEALSILKKYEPLGPEYVRFYNTIIQPRKAWVIRAVSVRGGYCDYYHTRIWLADKEWGYGPLIEEEFTSSGKLISTHMWPWNRKSSYEGKVTQGWSLCAEDINFEDRGFSFWSAPQTNQGYENPETWFTLRQLKKTVPTVYLPYMPIMPPKKLVPIEELFPARELQEAYWKHFPKRITSLPYAGEPIGLEKW